MPCSWAATGHWLVAGHLRIQGSGRVAVLQAKQTSVPTQRSRCDECVRPTEMRDDVQRSLGRSNGEPLETAPARFAGLVATSSCRGCSSAGRGFDDLLAGDRHALRSVPSSRLRQHSVTIASRKSFGSNCELNGSILSPQNLVHFSILRATSGHRLPVAVESEILGNSLAFRSVGLVSPLRRSGGAVPFFPAFPYGPGTAPSGASRRQNQEAAASMTLSSPSLTALTTAS